MNKGLEELIASAAAGLANRMYVFLEIRMDQPGATLYDLWYSAETYIHDLEADVVKARAEVERLRRGEVDGIFTSVVHECCEQVARVRELHVETERGGDPWCGYCISRWPCDTLAALDGDT